MNKFIIIDKQTRNLCSPDVFRRTDFSGVGSGLFWESRREIPKGTTHVHARTCRNRHRHRCVLLKVFTGESSKYLISFNFLKYLDCKILQGDYNTYKGSC